MKIKSFGRFKWILSFFLLVAIFPVHSFQSRTRGGQGNLIHLEQVNALGIGYSQTQVKACLGPSVLTVPDKNHWYYAEVFDGLTNEYGMRVSIRLLVIEFDERKRVAAFDLRDYGYGKLASEIIYRKQVPTPETKTTPSAENAENEASEAKA